MRISPWVTLVTVGVVLTACASVWRMPHEAKLREAQEIANRATDLYGVPRVKVYTFWRLRIGGVYQDRSDWIIFHPEVLDDVDFPSLLAHELGHTTLRHKMLGSDICDPGGPPAEGLWKCWPVRTPEGMRWLQQAELDANARAIEIMVRVMGMTQDAALRRFAALLVRFADAPPTRGHLGGCREVEDLLARFPTVAEFPPPQTCGSRWWWW
jgi:hypothetical protein